MAQVRVREGLLQGIAKDGYELYLGVPYAKPPVGALRWRAPLPPEEWEGVRPATGFPNRSMQEGRSSPFYDKEFRGDDAYLTPFSEDSLYLNIWAPARRRDDKLPVALYIHGGAFMGGCGHETEFDGAAYCARGVLLVTINYRLGAWGFLAHPLLSAESAGEGGPAVSGNYGILDQIAALKWVRDNISAFGGDPANITIFGQSAGCMSVQTLLSSPLARGLFARAILQSGVGLSYDHTLAQAEEQGEEFARNAGATTLDELRALSPRQVHEAAGPLIIKGFSTMRLPYTPIIDNHLLTEGYNSAMLSGRTQPVPTIVGSTKNDIGTHPDAVARGELGGVYHGSREWAEIQTGHGRAAYLYYFTRQLPGDDAGAFHSSELWYMFGTWPRCWRPLTDADAELSETMLDYWTNFMKTGDPNGQGLAPWRPYAGEGDIMTFDI